MQTSLLTAAGLALPRNFTQAAVPEAFSFILLGDLHYDKLEHHDFAWLEANHAGDISQIQNYSRITANIMPQLFSTLRQTITQLNQSPETRVAFVLQVGDVVEGLCGSQALATEQDQDVLAFIAGAQLGAPFLFAKGNHDITGDGAKEAYANVFHPYLSVQTAGFSRGGNVQKGYFAIEYGNSLFCFFDAYDRPASLAWLEATLATRTSEHCFVIIHNPVVPYGARADWIIYAKDSERTSRDKLLGLLGQHRAFVLGGHIHKYSSISRITTGSGQFAQLAVSSVINNVPVSASNVLDGLSYYNGDQILVEPNYSPSTAAARRAMYAAEAPYVKSFVYADLPGYTVITVNSGSVLAKTYAGVSHTLWRTTDLSALLSGNSPTPTPTPTPAPAAPLLSWDVSSSGSPAVATLPAASATNPKLRTGFNTLSRTGLTAFDTAGTFSSTGWNTTDAFNAANDYLSFKIQAAQGFALTLTGLDHVISASNTAPNTGRWGYSINGGPFVYDADFTLTPAATLRSWNFPDFTTTENVEFRFWGYGRTSTNNGGNNAASGGHIRIANFTGNDLVLHGSVAAVAPATVKLLSARSRLSHGGVPYDIELPLTGAFGKETRQGRGAAGDQFTLVLTFDQNLLEASVQISQGTATVSSCTVSPTNASQLIVELANMANAQTLTLQAAVTASNGATGTGQVTAGFLLGDVNGDDLVNMADVGKVGSQAGTPLSNATFPSDVNADGVIDAADINLTRTKSPSLIFR